MGKLPKLPAILLICAFMGAGEAPKHKSRLDALLAGIAYVESRNNPLAVSRLGASSGRGLYQVSEIAMEHVKWLTWDRLNGYKPNDLYKPDVCYIFASHYVTYLYRIYREKPDPTPYVLSAYWQGIGDTERNGIAWGYVREVLDAMPQDAL